MTWRCSLFYCAGLQPVFMLKKQAETKSDVLLVVISLCCVLSGQGAGVRSGWWGIISQMNRFVCVLMCVYVYVFFVSLIVCLQKSVCGHLYLCVCVGLACLSSPLAVIRQDIGSMTAHSPHHHPLWERLFPFHPVICVWLPVLGPWWYVKS